MPKLKSAWMKKDDPKRKPLYVVRLYQRSTSDQPALNLTNYWDISFIINLNEFYRDYIPHVKYPKLAVYGLKRRE